MNQSQVKNSTQINEIKNNFEHDTGVQFSVPKDEYFSVETLEKISGSTIKEDCCKLNDAFTDIYYEGKFLGEWQDISNLDSDKKNIEYNINCYEGNKCIKVEMSDWKVFQFFNRIKPETKRYEAIEFYIKSEAECNECLILKLDDYESIKISTNEKAKWEKKEINLNALGLNSDNFRKFMFQGRVPNSQIFYFDNIKLVKSNYDDKGECYDEETNINYGKYLNYFIFIRFGLLFLLLC